MYVCIRINRIDWKCVHIFFTFSHNNAVSIFQYAKQTSNEDDDKDSGTKMESVVRVSLSTPKGTVAKISLLAFYGFRNLLKNTYLYLSCVWTPETRWQIGGRFAVQISNDWAIQPPFMCTLRKLLLLSAFFSLLFCSKFYQIVPWSFNRVNRVGLLQVWGEWFSWRGTCEIHP